MLIHQQNHRPHQELKYYSDSISSASSNLSSSLRPSIQIVLSNLKENPMLIRNSNQNSFNSSSPVKHLHEDRKTVINKIEFDYLNRVTRTINEYDIKKYEEAEKEKKREKLLNSDSENDKSVGSCKFDSKSSNQSSFSIKNKKRIFKDNNIELLPGISIHKKSSNYNSNLNQKKKIYGFEDEKRKNSLINLDLNNRKNLVHSAPAKIIRRKSSIDSSYSSTSSNSSDNSELISNSGDDFHNRSELVKSRPKSGIRISSASINQNINSIQNNKEYKSIMRDQQQIFSKTMNVDKWIAIHKRPRTSTSLHHNSIYSSSSLNQNNNQSVTFSADNKNKIQINKNEINNQMEGIVKRQQQLQQLTKRVRSVKELSQLNLIDNIQMRIKREVQDNLKKISRHENQNHFNSVVERVRSFLYQVDEFNDVINPVIKLYEYNLTDN